MVAICVLSLAEWMFWEALVQAGHFTSSEGIPGSILSVLLVKEDSYDSLRRSFC